MTPPSSPFGNQDLPVSQKGEGGRRQVRQEWLVILSSKAAVLTSHCSSHLPTQVQIRSSCILVMHHFFPCNFIFLPFALENSIPCCTIPFPNKSRETKSPLVSAHRLQQGPYFNIFYGLKSSHLFIQYSAFSTPFLSQDCAL